MDNDFLKKRDSSHVQSVERAIILLEVLAKENRELSLTEISKIIGWPKSTVHGLITTLRDFNYVDQPSSSGHYKLGIRLFELGNLVARSFDIRSIAKPFMHDINNALGETIHLGTENDGEVLYLDKLDSHHLMRIVSDVGARLPMHCSGLGKSMLAYKSENEVKKIIRKKGMKSFTSRTIQNIDSLNKELKEVRKNGYAIDDREIMDSLRCVAAPIFDKDGIARYAISVSGIVSNFKGSRFEKAIELVTNAAKNISIAMGYRDFGEN